jgi:hypothetical protein
MAPVPPLMLLQPVRQLSSAAKGCKPGCGTPGGLASLWRFLSLHWCGWRCGLLIGLEVQLLIRAVEQVVQVRHAVLTVVDVLPSLPFRCWHLKSRRSEGCTLLQSGGSSGRCDSF